MFCDFSDNKSDAGHYAEALDVEALHRVAQTYLEEYNQISKKQMNLVLFRSSQMKCIPLDFYCASQSVLLYVAVSVFVVCF
jgi:hypothetical protein